MTKGEIPNNIFKSQKVSICGKGINPCLLQGNVIAMLLFYMNSSFIENLKRKKHC